MGPNSNKINNFDILIVFFVNKINNPSKMNNLVTEMK